ncbi:hypothetical protein CKL83_09150 [Bacillus anthracis]|uniref:Uncharacterized protein n=4 Tax=Bacillus cereus group TaxID=86661 RepID=A0A3Q0PQS2_BACAN|nr:hypothetical protein BA_1031 [Bacillus anthracis str. Ames]AAT30133.1 hypothetical protein GBAA_1031 [Bacillus anthracis str. 'Ames Ancestor']AIM04965.1 hypothetical protein BACvac02_1146 [Bacillus anthracis]EDS96329.1 hypothetical protein BAK_1121 [Bacillus anthracis str. A0389]EDT17096.1 hypothetical protein BAM_1069 [Bacillus anthracis str. A0465]MBR9745082.1 hypothetical protein [Bacillus cereus]OTW44461.1 hypothetical protein BK699_33250 [Bacillus thuringiensis serovar mexicanensis]O
MLGRRGTLIKWVLFYLAVFEEEFQNERAPWEKDAL